MKIELDDDYKKDLGSGNSTLTGYYVEARCMSETIAIVGGQSFDNRWRRAHFKEAPEGIGVPNAGPYDRALAEHGYFSYQAAQALRWWMHANADFGFYGSALESRLIKVQMKTEYSVSAVSAHEFIGPDDRTNLMPDWGVK